MRYRLERNSEQLKLSVEASFTLLDFMALFACLLLGVFFALFLWIFAASILIKLFTRNEFVFNSDTYKLTQYLRIFSYIRIKRRVIPFWEIKQFLFSNFDSGKALVERGLVNKEWFTFEIITKDKQRYRIVKAQPDELEEINELYLVLKERLGGMFEFDVEFETINE
ncbi:MAG: hypothetical protein ED557_00535 [Balneola sp.]|nr:MAG: hypothetical protein ED557_00535 [Balneola sp.]